ncbi:MAG: hypothetical protein R2781_08190 [Flavobacteriaceae bacterium]
MNSNNLGTFRILFIVKGILTFLLSLLFIAYAGFGWFFMNFTTLENEPDVAFNPGIIFVIFGGIGLLFCIAFGILNLLVAKYLKETRHYQFIFVVAILNCITGVLGILLGVFTIIELQKPEIKALFEKK